MNINNIQTIYAEQALVGCILIENASFLEIDGLLLPNDFSDAFISEVFTAVQHLITKNGSTDIVSVSQYIADHHRGQFDPFPQVAELANSKGCSSNIRHYADIIKAKSVQRRLVKIAQEIIADVNSQRENCLDLAKERIMSLNLNSKDSFEPIQLILPRVIDNISERNSNLSGTHKVKSGYAGLDNLCQGFNPGDLIIVAARPSMGKTLLAMNIAEFVANSKTGAVAIFSLEMNNDQLTERYISSTAKICANDLKNGNLHDNEYAKLASLLNSTQDSKMFLDDRSNLKVADMRSTCRKILQHNKLSLVVVDYLGLMSDSGENETIKIANISRGLKLLARDLNVPIIAVSQLNRALEQRVDKRPVMSDLRQSGSVEQDADMVIFIYRDDVYNFNSVNKGLAEIILAKNRNGETGRCILAFNGKFCRFDDYTGKYVDITSKVNVHRGFEYT